MKLWRSVLEYLDDKTVSLAKKEEYAKKRKTQLEKEITRLSEADIVRYLFNSKLPKSVKLLICSYVEKLSNSRDEVSYQKVKKITSCFRSGKIINEALLGVDYCPRVLKRCVIDEVYDCDLVELLSKKNFSMARKKVIADLKLLDDEAVRLLERDIPEDFADYLIEKRIYNNRIIAMSLSDDYISDSIKEKIINRCVDMSNIFDIARDIPFTEVTKLYRLKRKDISDFIDNLDSDSILDVVNNFKIPVSVTLEIIDKKIDVIEEAIKKADKKQIFRTVRLERDQRLVDLVLSNRKVVFYDMVRDLSFRDTLNMLNRAYLPDYIKNYIVNYHKRMLESEIKKHNLTNVRYTYLNVDSNLPDEIKMMIFNEYKKDFVDEFSSLDTKGVISEIKYGKCCDLLKHLLIDLKIDETNVYDLLTEFNLDKKVIDYILENRNDVVRNYLATLDLKKIMHLYGPSYALEIRNKMLENNIDIVASKLEGLSREEYLELLKDFRPLFPVKKYIMESKFGISETDLQNCLELLATENAGLLVENYENIKVFLSMLDIDFQAFLQYGSGSKKYDDWLVRLTDIINGDESRDFIKVKNYFFYEYYSDYLEKENGVDVVKNFLELVGNFSRYNELFIDLAKRNVRLSDEDKLNISFLLNVGNVEGIDVPKTLEEIPLYKQKMYEDVLEKVTSGKLDILEMKKIFNDLVFGNSDEVLSSIGGTVALKTLKKDNLSSEKICLAIDELMLYSKIIEMVNDTNNVDGLSELLEFVFSDIETLTIFQNIFSMFDRKVNKVFEADSKNHLTSLSKASLVEGVIDRELSKKYGGLVYDFSDKNYTLYAHVLSYNEDVDALIEGRSSGKSNFISVSPISYRGQKYYWDRNEMIFAYDSIPNGSFVCSSVSNMGTNYKIKSNSHEVGKLNRNQRGILETSAVFSNNSEALLFREGLKPCGIVLPGGREPTDREMEMHELYGLPFIITQNPKEAVCNPLEVFETDDSGVKRKLDSDSISALESIIGILEPNVKKVVDDKVYTGREVALLTDSHSMYEPTLAVLEDIIRNGISDIYSLGDNIGLGPTPDLVFDLLEEYEVKSVAGNSEYYCTLGVEPFTYFHEEKKRSQSWTEEKLGRERIKKLKLYPASIDLMMGDKKLALCHFANDVRWGYGERSTHTYQANYIFGGASSQFDYTNSEEANKKIDDSITSYKKGDARARGYVSAKEEPLFDGKKVRDYDAIIQGHVHFHMDDKLGNTDIHTLRAVGMGYGDDSNDTACYYVLKERNDGDFDIEKRLVKFNRNSLVSSIYTSGVPDREHVLKYVMSGETKKRT